MSTGKFTFKTEKSTGRYRSFYPDTHYIKHNKVEVGTIGDTAPHKIGLMTYEDITKTSWKWIKLKAEFTSLQEAKDFLNRNYEAIVGKYSLKDKV